MAAILRQCDGLFHLKLAKGLLICLHGDMSQRKSGKQSPQLAHALILEDIALSNPLPRLINPWEPA